MRRLGLSYLVRGAVNPASQPRAVQSSAARCGFRLGGKGRAGRVKIAWCLGVSVHVHGADQGAIGSAPDAGSLVVSYCGIGHGALLCSCLPSAKRCVSCDRDEMAS